jgi:hypothetical protein
MVHWVYVLECEEDRIYVGETKKLYSRLNRHVKGCGAKCTAEFEPLNIIGLYNCSKNISFINYQNDRNYSKLMATFNIDWENMYKNYLSNLDIENYFTECFMKDYGKDRFKVRGGKYLKLLSETDEYTPLNFINNITKRPRCYCGIPSEINMYNDELYFNCCLKNANKWLEFDNLDTADNCNFYKKYENECLF